MKTITIADMSMLQTPAQSAAAPTFRQKTELVRSLVRMHADVIEFPPIENEKTDLLFLRTVAPLAGDTILSQCAGYTEQSLDAAWNVVSCATHPRLSVAFPVSTTQMEFVCHKKPKAVAETVAALVARAKGYTSDVEFRAVDATRADPAFLAAVTAAAIEAGATTVTLCDTAAVLLPDEVASTVEALRAAVPALASVRLGAEFHDTLGMALSSTAAAVRAGADEVKCAAAYADSPSEEAFAAFIRSRGDSLGVTCRLSSTEISRVSESIRRIAEGRDTGRIPDAPAAEPLTLDQSSSITDVSRAVRALGYELSEEDTARVYEAFVQIAAKKPLTVRELEAIVATSAQQVPPTYRLVSYVITNGNLIAATAQVRLERDGTVLSGVCLGDGPIDAAFLAIEQIVGHHYELDEFQIQAVTEGREAMGSALVRLRDAGCLYSGNGLSTDIIGASIHAYLNALNKIVYQEN